MHPYADDLVLVSKIGARRDDAGAWLPAQHPEAALKRDVEHNVQQLGMDRLPVVNLRLCRGTRLGETPIARCEEQLAE